MPVKEIKTEEEIRKINYYLLGKIVSRTRHLSDENAWTDIEVESYNKNKMLRKFRFFDKRLLKYFVTKLKQANFRRKRMEIKFGSVMLLVFTLLLIAFYPPDLFADTYRECVNEQILSEEEKNPAYNLLSFPAVSTGDPDIIAVSYFNNKINIITTENYVTQYEYSGVPYSVYRTFLNSPETKDYYERCIKERYDAVKVY